MSVYSDIGEYSDTLSEWADSYRKLEAENTRLREINEAQAMDAWAHEVYLEKIAAVEAENERLKNLLAEWVAPMDGMDADEFVANVAARIKETRQALETEAVKT